MPATGSPARNSRVVTNHPPTNTAAAERPRHNRASVHQQSERMLDSDRMSGYACQVERRRKAQICRVDAAKHGVSTTYREAEGELPIGTRFAAMPPGSGKLVSRHEGPGESDESNQTEKSEKTAHCAAPLV